MGTAFAAGATLHAADWALTETDGIAACGPEAARPGVAWAWRGRLWRLDAPNGPLRLEGALGAADLHRMAAGRIARMMRRKRHFEVRPGGATGRLGLGFGAGLDTGEALLREGFRVTDRRHVWSISCLRDAAGAPRMAVFEGSVPPPGARLWICEVRGRAPAPAPAGREAAGLSPRAEVETPHGPVPAERLRPGDMVLTDAGPAPVRRARPVARASGLWLPPDLLGPGVPPRGLVVGRETWLGLEGPSLEALFGHPEALVRAGDLETLPGVRALPQADLVALTLEPHAYGAPLLMAGGVPCLAGRPDGARLRALGPGEAQIALGRDALHAAPRLVLRQAA